MVFVLGVTMNGYSQSVKIPFFGKMKVQELCGTSDCRPSYGIKAYVHKNDRLFYDGNYNSILGRKFSGKNIFDNHPSGLRKITHDDVNSLFTTDGTANLDRVQKKDFDAKLSADLKQILEMGLQLPPDLKAQLFAKLNNYVQDETNGAIDFSFEILELKKGVDIEMETERILSALEKGEKLITGISIITISGNWETKILKTVLDNFEIELGLKDKLSVDAKLQYDSSKNKLVTGTIQPFSFIIGDSYIIKK